MAIEKGAVRLPQPTATVSIPKKRKGKGKGKNKGKGKDEGQEKGKEKEVAIKEAANTKPDGQHLDEAQGPARLASLPTSVLPFPVTTSDQDHSHTHHHSTTVETGKLPSIIEDTESLVTTQGNMPASTRGMITPGKP